LTIALAVALGPLGRTSSASRLPVARNFEPGEVLVKLKRQSSGTDSNDLAERATELSRNLAREAASEIASRTSPVVSSIAPAVLGPRVKQIAESRGLDRLFLLKLGADADVWSAVNELRQRDDVEYAEPNYRVETASLPNDPRFWEQWALLNQGWSVAG